MKNHEFNDIDEFDENNNFGCIAIAFAIVFILLVLTIIALAGLMGVFLF